MIDVFEQGGYATVCKPEGEITTVTSARLEEIGEGDYLDRLFGDFKEQGCALLLMPSGCGGGMVVVGIMPLSDPEHTRRLEFVQNALSGYRLEEEINE